jgi:mRNA interferase MazF
VIFRGAIYEIKPAKSASGHEQHGRRCGVVIQSDAFACSTVTIALTSTGAGQAIYRPEIEFLGVKSRILTDQIYSFDRDALIKAIPRPPKAAPKQFTAAAEEIVDRIVQMTDNAGATPEHRALNYLAMRYPAGFQSVREIASRLTDVVRYDLPDDYFNRYTGHILGVDDGEVVDHRCDESGGRQVMVQDVERGEVPVDHHRVHGLVVHRVDRPRARSDVEDVLEHVIEAMSASGCPSFVTVLKRMGPGRGMLSFPIEGWTLAVDIPADKADVHRHLGLKLTYNAGNEQRAPKSLSTPNRGGYGLRPEGEKDRNPTDSPWGYRACPRGTCTLTTRLELAR